MARTCFLEDYYHIEPIYKTFRKRMIKLDRPHAQFLESNHGCGFSQDLSAKKCIPSPYSTLRWNPGINNWCLAIPQHPMRIPPPSWPYIDTIRAIIATHMWPKLGKIVEKHVFSLFASILLMSLFSGPTISVYPYYEITHGTLYSNNPKQLPHGPLQHSWPKMEQKAEKQISWPQPP
jgi:hypothetical protein